MRARRTMITTCGQGEILPFLTLNGVVTRKTLYWQRKLAGLCVDCGLALEDDTAVRCGLCRNDQSRRDSKYGRKPKSKRIRRSSTKQRRAARATAGLCPGCGRKPEETKWCRRCIAQRKASRIGVTSWNRVTRQRMPTLRAEIRHYQPLDERVENMRVRVLRALWWLTHDHDWVGTQEIFLAAHVESDCESTERNTAQVALGRLMKLGFAERCGEACDYRYRVSAAGRAEIARYRRGDLPLRAGRRAA